MTRPCQHDLVPSEHELYDVCLDCGSFKSTVAPPAEEVYTPGYWTPERGHSTMQDQVYNCEQHLEGGKSKNDFLIERIDVAQRDAVYEIGCSPGVLLRDLQKVAGFKRIEGCDPLGLADDMWNGDGWTVNSVTVSHLFPTAGQFECPSDYDLIIASDVFEHSHEPEAFLSECARLLKPHGQLLMMLPIVGLDAVEMPERMWHPVEHVWLHSVDNLTAMLGAAGFHSMTYDRWCPGHETISARRAA